MSQNPKKRQKIVLTTIGATGLCIALFQWGVSPALERLHQERRTAVDLQVKLEQQERILQTEERVQAEFEKARQEWTARADLIPPDESPFLWITERLYRMARDAGIQIENLQELAAPVPDWVAKATTAPAVVKKKDNEEDDGATPPISQQASRRFGPYGAQISFQADYEQFVRLIALAEKEFPLVSMMSSTVTAGRTPDLQIIRLSLEWPRYMGPAAGNPYTALIPLPEVTP